MRSHNIVGDELRLGRLPAYVKEYRSSRKGGLSRWFRFLLLMWGPK